MRQCTKCKATKPLEDFRIEKRTKIGRQAQCMECERSYRNPNLAVWQAQYNAKKRKEAQAKKAAKLQDQLTRWVKGELRTCKRCQIPKVITDFVLAPNSPFGRRSTCKACESARVNAFQKNKKKQNNEKDIG